MKDNRDTTAMNQEQMNSHPDTRTIEIDEGYTLDYLVHGFFTAVPALVLMYISMVDEFRTSLQMNQLQAMLGIGIGLLLILLAIVLIAIKSGIEINTEARMIRVYKSIFNKKIGSWTDLGSIKTAHLSLTHESQSLMSRGGERTYVSRTYDLSFIDDRNNESEFHQFTDKKMARRTLSILQHQCQIRVIDNTGRKSKD